MYIVSINVANMVTERDRELYYKMGSLDENAQDSSIDVHAFFELLREEIKSITKRQNEPEKKLE
jgi:hypothetical protein